MTVTTDRVQQGIVGDAVTTVFNYTIPYQDSDTLFVYKQDKHQTPFTEVLLRQSVDYTIVSDVSPNIIVTLITGGASVYPVPPDGLTVTWVRRETPVVQLDYDLTYTSPWVPVPTEAAFDSIILMMQELEEDINMAVKIGDFETPIPDLIPDPNKYLKWNSDGTAIISGAITDSGVESLLGRVEILEQTVINIQAELDAFEASTIASINNLQAQINALDVRVDSLELGGSAYRRAGKTVLTNSTYPTNTAISGLTFDYDTMTSANLYMEIKRSAVGDQRIESYMYNAVWVNNQWSVTIILSNMATAPTGINVVLVQNAPEKSVQLYFTAPTALPGTYDPANSWISWYTEDIIR